MRRLRALTLSSALLACSFAYAVNQPNFNAWLEEEAAPPPAPLKGAAASWAFASSQDAQRGTPTFLWASREHPLPPLPARATPEMAARWHLRQHAGRYGLPARVVDEAVASRVHDIGQGAILVYLGQRVDGVELFQTGARVLMRRNLELVAISGGLRGEAVPGGLKGRLEFRIPATEALSYALEDLYGVSLPASGFRDHGRRQGDYRYYDLSPSAALERTGLRFTEPARLKKVLYPVPDRLVPGWFLELVVGREGSTESDTFAFVIAADDGRVLHRQDLTAYDSFTYRVWAEPAGDQRPLAGPQADYAPHPTGQPDGSYPPFIAPNLVTADGFHTSLDGVDDPWLSSSATTLTGNNVNAYADHNDPDGYSDGDLRATLTGPHTFDRVYDTSQTPVSSEDQVMAAITQLFYVTNWLHSWYYDSGFDETAGNAQASNYGRGGYEGDAMLAEAQDAYVAGKRNNANMSTRSDGSAPRMQMYVWSGMDRRHLEVDALDRDLTTGTAAFGPVDFDVTGLLATVVDDAAPTGDGCTTIAPAIAGKIALIDRGTCTFKLKSVNAEAAGAIGVIIVDSKVASTPPGMANADPVDVPVNIPVLSVTLADGDQIKGALAAGPVTVRMARETGPEHDGTIDNTISAHEWGHYLHHRLVYCSVNQCRGESEGWADFVALHMVVREDDDLTGTYAMATYAGVSGADSAYYGIRRYPYSTDFTKNPLTFKHIQTGEPLPEGAPHATGPSDNAEVHNAGEIWATMLWEAYAALLEESKGLEPRLTYEEARRRMSDYVVGGMMLAPGEPTFTEQRDGILAAAAANDMEDFQVLAEAFARRGAGTCAVSPPREATDNIGVVESYELSPELAIVGLEVDDEGASCDHDGYLDAGETGRVTVRIMNTGPVALAGTRATIASSFAGVTFPKGATVTFGEIAPFAVGSVSLEVSLDPALADIGYLDLTLTAENDTACSRSVQADTVVRVNLDDVPSSSATDDVESDTSLWTEQVAIGFDGIWTRKEELPSAHVIHGIDPSSLSDASLVSPPLEVSADQDFVITFEHSYQFETGPAEDGGEDVFWDGGVMELSADGGLNWRDVSLFSDPGYNGVIGDLAGNPLMYRPAYVDTNPSYPKWDTVSVNMGRAYAGRTVIFRFRIGADQAAGGEGWQIDNISFQGLAHKPFSSLVADSYSTTGFYLDADGDGQGAGELVSACAAPEGYVENADDCDDGDALSAKGATEQCDGADNDCDGEIDEEAPDAGTWYADADEDGFGDLEQTVVACDAPDGYVEDDTDCDDGDSEAFPGAGEQCDGADNDCDGEIDEEAADVAAFYPDRDGDGHGSSGQAVSACEAPAGHVSSSDDCDDADSRTFPGAEELCDGVDNDCDDEIDEEVSSGSTFYLDADGDGQGAADETSVACARPEGYVTNDLDCDDGDELVYVGADEVCDGVDNDCDGEVDAGAEDGAAYYPDEDGDGYGANVDPIESCAELDGYVSNDDDCDDSAADTHPGAAEDGSDQIDHNCDGKVVVEEGGCSQAGSRGRAGGLLPLMAMLLAGGLVRRRR